MCTENMCLMKGSHGFSRKILRRLISIQLVSSRIQKGVDVSSIVDLTTNVRIVYAEGLHDWFV